MNQSKQASERRIMQLPYRQEYAHVDTRHAEDDWCKKAGCTPAAQLPAQIAQPEPREWIERALKLLQGIEQPELRVFKAKAYLRAALGEKVGANESDRETETALE